MITARMGPYLLKRCSISFSPISTAIYRLLFVLVLPTYTITGYTCKYNCIYEIHISWTCWTERQFIAIYISYICINVLYIECIKTYKTYYHLYTSHGSQFVPSQTNLTTRILLNPMPNLYNMDTTE